MNILKNLAIMLLFLLSSCTEDHGIRAGEYYANGDLRSALNEYKKAVEADTHDYISYNGIASIYMQYDKNELANSYIDSALKYNPNYVFAYSNKGLLMGRINRYGEAIEAFDKAIHIDNKYVDAYFNRGLVNEKFSKIDDAKQDFETAIKLDGKDYAAYFHLGRCLILLGDIKKGCDNLKLSIAIRASPEAEDLINKYCH